MTRPDDFGAEHLQRFCARLRDLLDQAGSPSYSELRALMPPDGTPADSTLSYLFNAKHRRAPDWELVAKVVTACATYARKKGRQVRPDLVDLATWRTEHDRLTRVLEALKKAERQTRQAAGTKPASDGRKQAEDVPNSPSMLPGAAAPEQVEQLAPAARSATGAAQAAPASAHAGDPATSPRRYFGWLRSPHGRTTTPSEPWRRTGGPPAASSPDRRSRRRAFALGGITVVVVVVMAVIVFVGSKPGSDADVLFRDDFKNPDRGWYVGQAPNGVAEYVSGQYRINANRGGVAVWSPAPAVRPAAAIQIIATARIANGQGGWGVWCRGTDTGERYEFIVSHAGSAYIKTPGDRGTKPVPIPSFDAYQDTQVVAECRDAPNGAGVELTLAVNGKSIPPYLDRGPLLGPGKVGVHAFSFGDVHGDPADVRFSYFEVDRLR